MAGYAGSSSRAILWNDGAAQQLSGEGSSQYNSVFVSGTDVYVAGYDTASTASSYKYRDAMLWKNGTPQILNKQAYVSSSHAYSVFVSGTDVYVAGYNDSEATLWKNGTAQTLNSTNSVAYSVYVSGANVYVAGNVGSSTSEYNFDNRATLWVNGVEQILSSNSSNANSVFVSGSDVYVAGVVYADGNFRATLWKNGTAQTLNNGPSIAYSVFVSGNDVYVAGLTATSITLQGGSFGQSYTSAMLWKNGIEQQISTPMSEARSVFVLGTDVYAGGFGQTNVGTSRFAKLWKNGTEYVIGDAVSYIHSVFVVP